MSQEFILVLGCLFQGSGSGGVGGGGWAGHPGLQVLG